MDTFEPTSALVSVDFPTLVRPTTAANPDRNPEDVVEGSFGTTRKFPRLHAVQLAPYQVRLPLLRPHQEWKWAELSR